MEAKCVNCRKVKPIFKRFEGETKKAWCRPGIYTTKATCWCEECWTAWDAKYKADQIRQDRELAELKKQFGI